MGKAVVGLSSGHQTLIGLKLKIYGRREIEDPGIKATQGISL